MSIIPLLIFLPRPAAATVQAKPPSTFALTMSGADAGTSTFTDLGGGKFQSDADFSVGAVSIKEKLTWQTEKGRATSFTFTMTGSMVKLDETWDGKTLTVVQDGKTKTFPLSAADVPPIWMSNYMPGMMETLPLEDRGMGPASKKIKIWLVEGANIIDGSLKGLGTRSCTIDGAPAEANETELTVGPVKLNLYFGPKHGFLGWEVPSQSYRAVKAGVKGLFDDPIAKFPELSQATFGTKTIRDLVCTTRDGVQLVADAVIPDKPGKYPVIMERTPYGRENSLPEGTFYAKRGYAFIVQDARGRGGSEGKFDPFVTEGRDGFDAIEWAAKLPFSDGKVGTLGGSYLGGDQWEAAVLNPPALKCIVPQVSPPGALENLPYEYGVFTLLPNLWWTRAVVGRTLDIKAMTSGIPHPEGMLAMPVGKVPEAALGIKLPIFESWIRRNRANQYGDWNFEPKLLNAKVPALQISGWWDGDGIGTDLHWLRMRAAGRTDQWLIEGPWVHEFNRSTKVGTVDYGPDSVIDLQSVYLRWFDHWLKGKSVGLAKQPKVRYFVIGENKWHDSTDFPDPMSKKTTLYLSANSRLYPHASSGRDTYVQDPHKKIDLKVLNQNLMEPHGNPFALKRPPAGTYAAYFTPLQTKDQIIEGPYGVDLYVKINRPNADLFATVVDVDPAGKFSVVAVQGKLNLAYRDGLNDPTNVKPGKIYMVHIFPWMSAFTLKKGHKLGVIITSDSFPATAHNPNTGESLMTAKRMVPVKVTIIHDGAHPSRFTFYSMQSS